MPPHWTGPRTRDEKCVSGASGLEREVVGAKRVAVARLCAVFSGLVIAGCVPVVPLPLPAPRSVERADSELEPIERLGRLQDGEFVAVGPRSVSASHLYVIVHGWQPGWSASVTEDPELRCWQAPRCEPWIQNLGAAILERDPHAIVLSYSWLDDAATVRLIFAQRHALAHTDLHGRGMAEAITQAVSEDFIEGGGRMHFIGHSYGARVATLAAFYLPKRPQHVTIFDSPDAPLTEVMGGQTYLADLLSKLPVGTDTGELFVDNYVSMVGRQYHTQPGLSSVVDVLLAAPYHQLDYRGRHLYPTRFYTATNDEDFGLGWSPLLASRRPTPGCYEQEYGLIALEHGCAALP
jgi:pimeloyl-ACP methyl ester carboxylesterase